MNMIYNLSFYTTKTFSKILLSLILLILTTNVWSQCTNSFTVSSVNATCVSNGKIVVTIPTTATTNCTNWVAEIVKVGGTATQSNVPVNGGDVTFSALAAGDYNVKLTDGTTTLNYTSNPVRITSSFVPMNVNTSFVVPTCPSSSSSYVADGVLTVNIPSGGIGPFEYTVNYTKPSPATGTVNLVWTGSSRSHSFSGIDGGVTATVIVKDLAGGEAGCETQITKTPILASNTTPAIAFYARAFSYERDCASGTASCNNVNLFVNLSNVTATKLTTIQNNNANITIAGVTYPLTYIGISFGVSRFKYDSSLAGRPKLTNGTVVTTTFFDGCTTISKTATVTMNNNFFNVVPTTTFDSSTCSPKYKLLLLGDQDISNTDGTIDRAVYFCPTNSILIEKRISTGPDVYTTVPSSSISPDPSTTTNPLGVTLGLPIPSSNAVFYVSEPGVYRVTATDDGCHSVSKIVTVANTNPFDTVTVEETNSLLAGTSAIQVNFNSLPPLVAPVKIKISRVDGQTSMTINPTQPYNLAGSYTINFPLELLHSTYPTTNYYVQDLPVGQYTIELTDKCGVYTKTLNLTLSRPTSYNPQVTVVEGCSSSNRIDFNMNPVNAQNQEVVVELYNKNNNSTDPLALGTLVQTSSLSGLNGSFINLSSGNYIIRYRNLKAKSGYGGPDYSAAMNNFATWEYKVPVSIEANESLNIATNSIFCDLSNNNSGIVNVQILNNVQNIKYPLYALLFNANDFSQPARDADGNYQAFQIDIYNGIRVDAFSFEKIPTGNYVVRLYNDCYSLDANVSLNNSTTAPEIQASATSICKGTAVKLSIYATQNLYEITWKDQNGTVLGTGSPFYHTPQSTTTYTAVFKLLDVYGCSGTVYTKTKTVTVLDTDLSLAVSDIDLCRNSSPSVTITNAQPGFDYEIVNEAGNSFSPVIKGSVSSISNLTISIPSYVVLTTGTILKVIPKSNIAGTSCSGVLTDVVHVISGNSNSSLSVSDSVVCNNTNGTIVIGNAESGITYEVLKNGNSFTPPLTGIGTGANLSLLVPYAKLTALTNEFTIKTSGSGCAISSLVDKAIISVNQAPVVSGTIANTTVEGCSVSDAPAAATTITELQNLGLVVTDDYTTNSNLIVSSSQTVTGTCPITIERIYTVKDACNESTVVSSKHKIFVQDTTLPIISGTISPITVTGLSVNDAPPAKTTVADVEAFGFTISDNCTADANLVVSHSDSVSGSCPIIIERTYSVKDACNNITTAAVKQIITINTIPPQPIIAATGGTTFCLGGSVILSTSASVGYQWYKDNVAISGANTQSFEATVSGNYKVEVTNSAGCTSLKSVGTEVTVNALPVATINNGMVLDFLSCNSQQISLTASSGLSYVWYYNPTNDANFTLLSGATAQTIIAANTGFYKVKVVNSNCEATSQVTQIAAAPAITDTTLSTCAGDTITLSSNTLSFSNPTYQWNKNGVAIPSATTASYQASSSGKYTVTVTDGRTSGSLGTVTSCEVYVTINPLPIANAGVDFISTCTVNPSGLQIGMTPQTGFSYEWTSSTSTSGLSSTTLANPIANPSETTIYQLKVTDNTTLCYAVDEIEVVVNKTISQALAGTDSVKTCLQNTNGVTLGGSDPVAGVTYSWSPSTSLDNPLISKPLANPTQTTIYTLTTTNVVTGCQATDTVIVTVNTTLPVVDAGPDFIKTCITNVNGKEIGTVATGSGYTYSWSPSIGLDNSTIANPVANPAITTTYTLTVTDMSTGCSVTDSVTVSVDTVLPTANAGDDFTKTCLINASGKEIGTTANVGNNYSWSSLPITSGLSNVNSANPIANPIETTTYTLKVTSITNGCESTDNVTVTVNTQKPIADAGADFTKTCATNALGKMIGTGAQSGISYSWSPITGLDSASAAMPIANPIQTTTYTLTTTNTNTGCSSTDTVLVTVNTVSNPVPLVSSINNSCPLETVNLVTIQPAPISGIVYEWWTGTSTSRGIQIIDPTTYSVSGKVYLWSRTSTESCYNDVGAEVTILITPCCVTNVGVLKDLILSNTYYSPATINTLQHINYATPSIVRYVLVNNVDGKIKQINQLKPEFSNVTAGDYTVHALVFGPTANPTGIAIGNKLNQVQPSCGNSASYPLTVLSNSCISTPSFSQTILNTKHYALLNLITKQFDQVNTTGVFSTYFTGIAHQIISFNYTGLATGIIVGGTVAGVSASNLEIVPGEVFTGCVAVRTQIDGVLYNDKEKRCVEGLNTQQGLPETMLYAKLLDGNGNVVSVSSLIQSPSYYFNMSPDLFDGTYSIIIDNNNDINDSVATYPSSWKGNSQTFTVALGQIVEYLSNTANFVPMCMQSATEKPAPKRTPNLVGNTYHFCKGETTGLVNVDSISGATVNWYTTPTGGSSTTIAPTPNTSVVGITTYYVSQTLNGAESDRTEINIQVHTLPEQPTAIAGDNLVGAGTTQNYYVVDGSTGMTYNWILPTDWTGSSTSKDITVQVGTREATIGVTATSIYGCVSPIQELVVRVVIEDDIEVYNSLSPNGDGDNDVFVIRNIDFYPENTLSIFNRWGIEVYHVTSYGQNDNFFKGYSDGRSTVNRDVELPEGTYFYTLTYKNSKGIEKNLSGYLYIKQ